jgi:hypothetical protein
MEASTMGRCESLKNELISRMMGWRKITAIKTSASAANKAMARLPEIASYRLLAPLLFNSLMEALATLPDILRWLNPKAVSSVRSQAMFITLGIPLEKL